MSKGTGGGELRRFYMIFGLAAVVGLGVVGYAVGSRAFTGAVQEPVELEGIDDLRRLAEMAVGMSLGEAEAPVTIIFFSDYLCSYCAVFSLQVRPAVEAAFVETGQARLVFQDFPLAPQTGTFLAARAARCAGDQELFWEYHDLLYRRQRDWGVLGNKIPAFQGFAGELGLDVELFKGCLNSDRHAEAVTANMELARALGLPGTPAILVGTGRGMSRRLSNYSFQAIQEAVEGILAGGPRIGLEG